MLVSIVIPVYGEESHLPQLLESLASQTFIDRAEVILVEYNPEHKTSTQKIVQQFQPKVKIELLPFDRKGITLARNHGIYYSDSEIICNLDADNHFSHEHCLEMLCAPILNAEAVMTCCDNLFDENELKGRQGGVSGFIMNLCNVSQRVLPSLTPGICISRQTYRDCGGFPNVEPQEAVLLSMAVLWRGGVIKHIPGAAVITSPRRAMKENELGFTDALLNRSTAVRDGKIIRFD